MATPEWFRVRLITLSLTLKHWREAAGDVRRWQVVGLLVGALERLRTACAVGLHAIAVRVPSEAIKHRARPGGRG